MSVTIVRNPIIHLKLLQTEINSLSTIGDIKRFIWSTNNIVIGVIYCVTIDARSKINKFSTTLKAVDIINNPEQYSLLDNNVQIKSILNENNRFHVYALEFRIVVFDIYLPDNKDKVAYTIQTNTNQSLSFVAECIDYLTEEIISKHEISFVSLRTGKVYQLLTDNNKALQRNSYHECLIVGYVGQDTSKTVVIPMDVIRLIFQFYLVSDECADIIFNECVEESLSMSGNLLKWLSMSREPWYDKIGLQIKLREVSDYRGIYIVVNNNKMECDVDVNMNISSFLEYIEKEVKYVAENLISMKFIVVNGEKFISIKDSDTNKRLIDYGFDFESVIEFAKEYTVQPCLKSIFIQYQYSLFNEALCKIQYVADINMTVQQFGCKLCQDISNAIVQMPMFCTFKKFSFCVENAKDLEVVMRDETKQLKEYGVMKGGVVSLKVMYSRRIHPTTWMSHYRYDTARHSYKKIIYIWEYDDISYAKYKIFRHYGIPPEMIEIARGFQRDSTSKLVIDFKKPLCLK